MATWTIELLGDVRVRRGGRTVDRLRTRSAAALLTLLCLERRPMAREELVEQLWPERAPGAGRGSLRQALAALRRALGDQAPIRSDRRSVELVRHGAEIDVVRFFDACARGRAEGDAGAWREAVDLYGPLCPGVELEALEPWRAELRRHASEAHKELAFLLRREGDLAEALSVAQAAARVDSLDEEAARLRMQLLRQVGDEVEALRVYMSLERDLAEELGVAPSEATQLLVKDLRGGVRRRSNVPRVGGGFVGRAAESTRLAHLLGHERWVTVCGPAGVGKSRLACEVAGQVLPTQPGGVWWIGLASLEDPQILRWTVLKALADLVTDGAEEPLVGLAAALATRRALLVLDNAEHLRDALATLVVELLEACPALSVLCTSRSPLGAERERVLELRPLRLPEAGADLAELGATEAVALFLEVFERRAGQPLHERAHQRVAELCAQLEGLPLAVELAASRAARVGLAVDTDGLDLPASDLSLERRHSTLRAAIASAVNELSPAGRGAFARLSAFTGAFSPERSSALGAAAPDVLGELIDAQLVQRELTPAGDSRLRLLRPVRLTAAESLDATERDALCARHVGLLVELARAEAPRLVGPERGDCLEGLEREDRHVRALLEWGLVHDHEAALRLAVAWWSTWYARGREREGRRWLESLLAKPRSSPSEVQAEGARAAGVLAWSQGDLAAARRWLEESIATLRPGAFPRALARALQNLGIVAEEEDALDEAARCYGEAAALLTGAGAEREAAIVILSHGNTLLASGDCHGARDAFESAVVALRALADRRSLASALTNAGYVELLLGRFEAAQARLEESEELLGDVPDPRARAFWAQARALLEVEVASAKSAEPFAREAVELLRELGARIALVGALRTQAEVAAAGGDRAQARRLLEEALGIARQAGCPLNRASCSAALVLLSEAGASSPSHAREALEWSCGRGPSPLVAEALEAAACVFSDEEPLAAARCLGAADGLRAELGTPAAAATRARLDPLRLALGELESADALEACREALGLLTRNVGGQETTVSSDLSTL